MTHLRIWNADCALLDVVLSLTFDSEELINCCRSAGIELEVCRHRKDLVVTAVHRHCHQDSPFSRLIERRLNLVHGRELAAMDEGFDTFATQLLCGNLLSSDRLAGVLWALATCDEQGANHLRTYVRGRLTLAGAESLRARNAS